MSHLRHMNRWTWMVMGIVAAAAAAVALTIANATGADAKDQDSSEPRGEVTFAPGPPPVEIEDFKNCMSEHGVDVPEPGERFEGPREVHEPSASEREAFEACGDELPRPPHGDLMVGAPPGSKAFRQCVSKHGADLPPPPRPPGDDD